MQTKAIPDTRLLHINSSSRYHGSSTRSLTNTLIDKILAKVKHTSITTRDVAQGLPFIDETWINANFTQTDERTAEQNQALALSDQLIKELQENDVIIIGVPVYNFAIPASLKAWIDLIARAGVTFRYTDTGPQGLLQNKKAIVILASGGTAIGSEIDFASGYLRHLLSFIGITDVEFIAAERLNIDSESALLTAHEELDHIANKIGNTHGQAA